MATPKQDPAAFFALLTKMEALWDRQLNDIQRQAYLEVLRDDDLKWIELGIMRFYGGDRSSRFMPKPGEIRSAWLATDEWQEELLHTRIESRANPTYLPGDD